MDNILYSNDGTTLLRFPVDYEGCFNIPSTVNRIGAKAFSGCTGLIHIYIPDSVTEIGDYAFEDCSGLTDILLPDTIASMGSFAFSGCSGLIHVYIPCSVTSVGEGLFDNCSRLMSIYVSPENEHFDSRQNCNAIIESATGRLVTACNGTVFPDGTASTAFPPVQGDPAGE